MPLAAHTTHSAEDRSNEILMSIRQIFAEKGFDGASMQDLARAAGMSVGNFYRYFPSKAAIIQAMCWMDMADIQKDFADIQMSPDPLATLRDRIVSHFTEDSCKDGQLWAEVTAAAIRKPEVSEITREMEEGIFLFLSAVFASVTNRSHADARARYEGQCQMLIMLVKAVSTRTAQFGAASPPFFSQLTGLVDRILSEISHDKAEG